VLLPSYGCLQLSEVLASQLPGMESNFTQMEEVTSANLQGLPARTQDHSRATRSSRGSWGPPSPFLAVRYFPGMWFKYSSQFIRCV
jgi:hypothetical protein